jgi:hypothetical protein
MIVGELKISANSDVNDYAAFDLTASRNTLQVHAHFWEYVNVFEQFGARLAVFPQSLDDTVEFEIGKKLPGFSGSYLLLKAYCYDANGHVALKIIVHNNASEPEAQQVEFSIPADIASLNQLGRLLKNSMPSGSSEIVWQAQVS